MIRYLIKNNIKLMTRSITNIVLFIVGPLMVIAILSNAFNDLLKKYENEEINAGYMIEDEAISEELLNEMITAASDNDINLEKYDDTDPEKTVRENDLCGFIVFSKDKNTFYENEDHMMSAKVFEYFVSTFFENVTVSVLGLDTSDIRVHTEHPSFTPEIEADDYYGIVEIVYFGWCAIVCGAGLLISEKKHRFDKKYTVSNLSAIQLYLGKFLALSIVVGLSSLLTAVLSVLLFGVHWGAPILSALILLLSASAAVAFGLLVYNVFDNLVVTIIAVFSIVWMAGFFGGAFETYMLSSYPESVKRISPIYHINRCLTEFSCMGHSDYIDSALLYCVLITIICSALAVLADMIRRNRV